MHINNGDLMQYLKQFMFFSVAGYLFETIFTLMMGQHFNSGILKGPYTPIYGLGLLLVIYGGGYLFRHLHLKRWKEIIVVFGIFFFTITILELTGGILIEKIFHKVFWSYKKFPLSYGHYISIEISLIWSSLSLVIYYFKDKLTKLIDKIPTFIYWIFYICFIIDILYKIKDIAF